MADHQEVEITIKLPKTLVDALPDIAIIMSSRDGYEGIKVDPKAKGEKLKALIEKTMCAIPESERKYSDENLMAILASNFCDLAISRIFTEVCNNLND